jgi:outer membrane protein OmpA-like peptidoglycan-associated protein
MLVFIIIFFTTVVSASDIQDLKPAESEVAVNVVFTDSRKEPRSEDTVIFENIRTEEIFSGITDSLGKVTFYLTKGDTFINKIIVREGDTVDYGQVAIPYLQKLLSVDLAREYEYQQRTFILENVLFDTDRATLKKESYQALEELYQSLVFSPGMEIEIAGHTDNSGSPEHNLKLSQARANSVKNYLVKKGIASSRIRAKGYGQSNPIADNTGEEGRRLNRRTEVRIIKE